MAETAVTSNLGWDNFFSTTTTGALTATTTTIPLATPPTPTEGFLVLDPGGANEIIFYNSVSGNNVIVPSTDDRGRGDSTAQAHSSGITVKMNTVGMMFEALQSGLALTDSAITTAKIANAAVTPAKWTNPYCFRAYASGATTIADGTDTKVLFATEEYDYNSNFASSTYTAPVNGVYHFDGRVAFNTSIASAVLAYALIYVNGAIAFTGVAQSAGYATAAAFTVSGDVYVGAGQAVELWMYQDSGGTEATQASQGNTWFSGHLVHAV